MKIHVDIGNTNVKIGFNLSGKEYINSYNTNTEYTVDSFYNQLPSEIKMAVVESVMISSVVPSVSSIIEGMFKNTDKSSLSSFRIQQKTGIKINASNPKTLGSDLVALASFVRTQTDSGIIVNMGTATTITHIKDSTITGVIILPGFKTALSSLVKNSAKINEIKLYLPINKSMGNTTDESISIGMIKGTTLMIRGLVEGIDNDAELFISGGNSRAIKEYLPEFKFVKEATIKGIQAIEEYNEK